MMKFYFVLLSMMMIIVTYCVFSSKIGNWINAATPLIALSLPINYILELFYIKSEGSIYSNYSYFFVYCCYTVYFFMFCVMAYHGRSRRVFNVLPKWEVSSNVGWVFFALSVVFYFPVLVEYGGVVQNFREIYIATRTGYGVQFFLSAFFAYVGLIVVLVSSAGWMTKAFAILFALMMAVIHGSKGQIFTVFFIFLLYAVAIKGIRVGFRKFLMSVCIFLVVGVSAYYAMSMGVDSDIESIFLSMAGYSDYNRNAALLIDDYGCCSFGKIFLENNFYSRIPRIFWQDKPKDYGEFYLALLYFRDSFYRDEGVPSFGIGSWYTDFGLFSIILFAIFGGFSGYFSAYFENRLRGARSSGDFVMYIFFSGVVLLPIGVGYLLPEHAMCAVFLNLLRRIGFFRKRALL